MIGRPMGISRRPSWVPVKVSRSQMVEQTVVSVVP
jgi:hypothetical protein